MCSCLRRTHWPIRAICYRSIDSSLILQGLLCTRALILQQTVLLPNHKDPLSCGFLRVRYVLQWSSDLVVKFCFHRLFSAEDILFRVHKSHLAHHSAFFRDLFPLPQPLVGAESSPSSAYEKRYPTLEMDTTNELEGCRIPISRAVYRNHDLSCSHCPSHSTLIFVIAAFCHISTIQNRSVLSSWSNNKIGVYRPYTHRNWRRN